MSQGGGGVGAVTRGAGTLRAEIQKGVGGALSRTWVSGREWGHLGDQSCPALPGHQVHAGWERSENREPKQAPCRGPQARKTDPRPWRGTQRPEKTQQQ